MRVLFLCLRPGLIRLISRGEVREAESLLLGRRETGRKTPAWEQNLLAVCKAKMKGLEEAETLLGQEHLKRPKDAKVLNNLGNIALIKGDRPRAINYYRRAAKANPWAPEPRFNLSLAYSELGEFEKALYAHKDYTEIRRVLQLVKGFLFFCLLGVGLFFLWIFY